VYLEEFELIYRRISKFSAKGSLLRSVGCLQAHRRLICGMLTIGDADVSLIQAVHFSVALSISQHADRRAVMRYSAFYYYLLVRTVAKPSTSG
jgi:hypothetical protein